MLESVFLKRVASLALTDSVMYFAHRKISKEATKFFDKNCCNWLASDLPLDTPIQNNAECLCVSAGHKVVTMVILLFTLIRFTKIQVEYVSILYLTFLKTFEKIL